MNGSNNIKNVDNEGVSIIYKIFEGIYLKAPTFLKDLSNNSVGIVNIEPIREHIDFKKIDTKFKNGEYCNIPDAIKDIRTVFLNCYSIYGARSNHTKQSLELEELLEEKISYLDKNYKLLADVNITLNLLNIEGKPSSKLRFPKDCYDSVLLQSVAHCRPERLKKYHKTLSTTLTIHKDNAHILEKISSWEIEVNFNEIFHQYISSMWELPEIGNFLAILFKKLDLNIINQGEIERMFIMPKESRTMGKVMTTLLAPGKKTKCIGPVMPYKVWSEKLSKKVSDWCKVYHTKKQNKVIAMDLLGIHPDFWTVVNGNNPLIEKDYSELSYFIKVWLVKGLCDYVTIKFKTINDIITSCNARQCTIWKNDLETEEYFFFDSMPDLRIYYCNIPYDEPSLEFLESVKTDNEVVQFEDKLTMNGFSESFHTKQKGKNFKLIADSVESLRAFVNELDMEEKLVPESLISSLENFIVNIEPEEYNYIAMNNDSKVQSLKDRISYSDRIQKDKDNITVREEKGSKSIAKTKNEKLIIAEKRQSKVIEKKNNRPKCKVKQPPKTPSKLLKQIKEANKKLKVDTNNLLDTNQSGERNRHNRTLVSPKNVSLLKAKDSKSIYQAKNEELIIAEKRQRKLIVQQNFDTYESDEYVSENDNYFSDFTDSEDEWGAMNQSKFKGKRPKQTPSKRFIELEKRAMETEKMSKNDTNQSDGKQLRHEDKITSKMCKTHNKDKSIKSVILPETQNEGKLCSNNTNTLPLVNGNNEVKQPLQTPPKRINSEKQSSEENTVLKHESIKGFEKKDKNIKKFKLLKTQNEIKCSNNTNTFVNGHNQILGGTKKIDTVCSNEGVIHCDKKDSQKPPDGLRQVEIINLDEDMQNDCEVFNDNFESSTYTENKNRKSNKQIESSVISIEDDDNNYTTNSSDEVQFISMTEKPKCSPLAKNEKLIIAEKRQSKVIEKKNNRPKCKVKQPPKTPSKLLKQIKEANKKLKVDTNNLLDTNQSGERNRHNRTLVSPKNVSLLKAKDSKSIYQAKNEELIIAEKRQRKLIVQQNFDTYESDEYVSENDNYFSDFTDSEDEWGAMNQSKFKGKRPKQTPSKRFIELEKRAMETEKMSKNDTNQSDGKQLRHEDKITSKMCKTHNKDKSIKSVILPETQNEGKLCSNNTNTLPLVNGNNEVKQPLQTPPKRINSEKQSSEENTVLKHESIKGFEKKDKNIKKFKLLKTQNEIKCSNNTNTFVNGHNQILGGTKKIDTVCSNEGVIHCDKKDSQKPPDGLRQVEIINLDEDMQNDCEVFNDNFESSTYTENKNRKSNKQIESSVISIEDDDNNYTTNSSDEVQFISMTEKPKCSPLAKNEKLIIAEKRQSKVIEKKNNRPKCKVKQPPKTPSKLLKQIKEANKKLKVDTNNLLDTNQSGERNRHNRTLVSPKNVSLLKAKDSKSIYQAKNEELIIAEKRQRKLIVQQNFDTYESDEYVSENDNYFSDFTDSEDEWGAMNQSKFKGKRPKQTPSKRFIELEKRAMETEKMSKNDTNQSDGKQLRHEDKITSKMCKTHNKDKSIKSVILPETQNEGKLCSNNTNTLPLVNGNNEVKQPLQTPPKRINSEKQSSEENTVLKHESIKGFEKKDKNIKKFKLLKTQNEIKCSNNTNIFVNGHNQILGGTKKIDTVCSNEGVIHCDKKDSQKPPDGLRQVEIINLDEDMQNDCEVFNDNFESSTYTENKNRKSNKQIESSVISIEDDDNNYTTNSSDEVQFISMTEKPKCSPLAKNEKLIIAEKRQSKVIEKKNNRPKCKVKQPPKTPSKLLKQIKEANKKLKVDTNNLLDTNQSGERNRHNRTLVSPKNVSLLKAKDSKSIYQAKNEELIIAEKRQRKLIVQQNFDTYESDEYVSENDNYFSDFTDSEDEWGAMNQSKFKGKRPKQTPSKRFIELEKRAMETEKMSKNDTNQSDGKQLRHEDKITSKMCKTHNKDKSIKSVILPETQNEGKLCSNNTNTLPLVNGNNEVKQPLQTPPKRINSEKQSSEENTVLKHESIKGFEKKDKNIKKFKLLKTQNEIKCSNNTNTFVNGHNQILGGTKKIDTVCSNEGVIHCDKKDSQKPPDGLRQVEIINLDEDMQNDCEVFNDNFESSTYTENKNRKSNKQIESSVISIEDDDNNYTTNSSDEVQFISTTEKPKCLPLKKNKPCSLKSHLNNSYNSVSANSQIIPTSYINHKAKSSIIDKLSKNVTIMPANVIIPKGIEVSMMKTPQTRIYSNFNSVKRKSTMSNGHPPDNPSTINVKCELISKPDLNGEVKFYVRLPNGKEHPGPDELINLYLKQHNNQLPDYWLVPLPVEVAKQYGFN